MSGIGPAPDEAGGATTVAADPDSAADAGNPGPAYCRIFPPIGIARLGNSPDEYVIGPEVPGRVPDNAGSYKDPAGRVKRQAARFRVYAFDEQDRVLGELPADHPDVEAVTWTVTLANAKAAWWPFAGTDRVADILENPGAGGPRRNADIPAERRAELVIGPATAEVTGRDQRSAPLDGRFLGWPERILLGELRTDDAGRLLVLGGRGRSASVLPDNPLAHYANNDGWFDDTADGPVEARVTLRGGVGLPVRGRAWVVVAPPHFSPHTANVVTGYDVMCETAIEHDLPWREPESGSRPAPEDPVSFSRDILPILRRLDGYQWVSDRARRGHSAGVPGSFLDPATLDVLADPSSAADPASPHRSLFARIRTPLLHRPLLGARPPTEHELHPQSQAAIDQANLTFMPPLAGDEGDLTHPIYDAETNRLAPSTWLSLTATQYRLLARWQDGDFVDDRADQVAPPATLEQLPPADQPAALTRATLEACQGGAFFPGIEFTSVIRFPSFYSEAFRPSDQLAAGEVTHWMALPWQADFYECRDHWWPAIRPDQVVTDEDYERVLDRFPDEAGRGSLASLLVPRRAWARGIGMALPPRPGLPGWPPPSPDAPEYSGVRTAADYFRITARQLQGFARVALSALPGPDPGEVDGVFLRREQEFLDRSGLSDGGYVLPVRNLDWDLAAYWNNQDLATVEEWERTTIRGSVRKFLREQAAVDQPAADESIDDYAGRLAAAAAGNPVWQGLFDAEWRRRVRHRGKNDLLAEDLDRVPNWTRLGFVVPREAAGETVYVEADRDRFRLDPFRDHLYHLLNIEHFPEFLPKARELADEYLRLAWQFEPQLRAIPTLEQYGFFPYDEVTYRARLEKIYDRRRRQAEAYNPADPLQEPMFRTPAQVVERIRQLAPFNQLDGSWLERIAHAGPGDEVQGYLFEIWSDEVGNGDPAQNHANVYTDLMHSASIYPAPITSRAYADDSRIWDSSYISPAYQSAIAQFPETYAPELLGMTLYLEWEAVFLPAMVKLYEYHGYNSLFYKLHVAIDNPVNGHGARARDAVAHYLDHVREESGEREMQEHWRRVWNGYLAFAFIGGGDWQYFFSNPPTPAERVVAMLEEKRHYGQLNHGRRRLGPNFLNDWLDEPEAYLEQLVQSDLITPGDAKNSRIFAAMDFGGPMLKVFTAQDKAVLAEYIDSLPPAPLGTDLDPAAAMQVLLRELAPRAMAEPDHAGFLLTGSYSEPADGTEQVVTKPVSWWFGIGQPERLMAALADPDNGWIEAGDPSGSRFVRELLSQPRRMSRFLLGAVPEVGDRTPREVIIDWISAGCPLPGGADRALPERAVAVPRLRVRAAGPGTAESAEPHADVLRARAASARSMTRAQRAGLARRFYGPGGGACH